MKMIHIADTHLGCAAYRRISEAGYNQREEDICNAFKSAIDEIIELNPDLVLHAGDLFDSVRPTNRILHFAIEQILRLTQNKITTIIISGNHDTPKQRYIGSVFKIFEVLTTEGYLKVIFNNDYTRIKVKDTLVHAIPQCTSDEIFKAEMAKVTLEEGSKNVLMLHAGVTG
ncbi:MAG: metallophosphoesterase, partial [Candidatus Saganbacteria bacterium]|nr:metallophosphoesterase [Candidatus Saganbacteria bacterium]